MGTNALVSVHCCNSGLYFEAWAASGAVKGQISIKAVLAIILLLENFSGHWLWDAVLLSLVLDPRLVGLENKNALEIWFFSGDLCCLGRAFTELLCCACRTLKPP